MSLDSQLARVNTAILELPYMKTAYGRGFNKDGNLWGIDQNREYRHLQPIDTEAPMTFFFHNGQSKVLDNGNNREADLSLIFWGNAEHIDASSDYLTLTALIERDMFGALEFLSSYERTEIIVNDQAVYDGTGFAETASEEKYLYMPYIGIRINFKMWYIECDQEAIVPNRKVC